jgi:carboxyl-terminal processing protease
VQLTTFGDKTADELVKALAGMDQSVQGLILDLRGNAGGLLDAAVAVVDLFLDRGQIVTTRDRDGRIEGAYSASPSKTRFHMPLAILVDRYSASASEIVAACMQDHQRAKIIGERSWGKGTVQNVIFLEGGRSALKLTTSAYWRPSLKNIHRGSKTEEDDDWGVKPDAGFEIDLNDEQYTDLVVARRARYRSRAMSQGSEAGPAESTREAEAAREAVHDAGESSTESDAEDFEDPYMTRAIEYLRAQVPGAARQAA